MNEYITVNILASFLNVLKSEDTLYLAGLVLAESVLSVGYEGLILVVSVRDTEKHYKELLSVTEAPNRGEDGGGMRE